jgi:hypothetical protein
VLITNFTGTISAIETFAHRMPRKPLMKILTLIADAHLQKHQVLAADLKPLLARRDLGTRVERLRNLLVTESDVTRTAAQQEFGVTAQTLDAALGSSKLSDAIVTGLEEAWRRAVVHVRERVGIENVLHSDDVDDANGSELMIDDGPTEAA